MQSDTKNTFDRPAGGAEVYNKGDGTFAADWFAGFVCNRDICDYWTGILLGSSAQDMLQPLRYW